MFVHCVPLNDEKEHDLTTHCWCDPVVDYLDPETNLPWTQGTARIIHRAADCREYSEEITGEAMAPDKKWKTLIV